MNERISKNNHLIGKLPKTIASHDSFQSPKFKTHHAGLRAQERVRLARARRAAGHEDGVAAVEGALASHIRIVRVCVCIYIYIYIHMLCMIIR